MIDDVSHKYNCKMGSLLSDWIVIFDLKKTNELNRAYLIKYSIFY